MSTPWSKDYSLGSRQAILTRIAPTYSPPCCFSKSTVSLCPCVLAASAVLGSACAADGTPAHPVYRCTRLNADSGVTLGVSAPFEFCRMVLMVPLLWRGISDSVLWQPCQNSDSSNWGGTPFCESFDDTPFLSGCEVRCAVCAVFIKKQTALGRFRFRPAVPER